MNNIKQGLKVVREKKRFNFDFIESNLVHKIELDHHDSWKMNSSRFWYGNEVFHLKTIWMNLAPVLECHNDTFSVYS